MHHAAPALPSGTVGAGGSTLAALWAWLLRPPVAAGFALVFVSTVVGVMWMGRPVEEAGAPAEEKVAAATPTSPAPAPAARSEASADRGRVGPGLPEAAKRATQAPAPAPIVIPAPQDARTPDAPLPTNPAMTGKRSCGGARQVTS